MTNTAVETVAPIPAGITFAKTVVALASALHPNRIGKGSLAELRRMDPTAPVLPPVFWTTLFGQIPEDLHIGDKAERAWAVILQGMAEMAPESHRQKHGVGSALAETKYSEPRFIRLLRADDDALAHEVGTVCRWLSAKAEAVDWVDFAGFIMARLTKPDRKESESRTHGLSRDYFRALSKQKSEESAP
jgi:CRISPR type I-E-associated protein CasB/Cse2